MLSEENRLEKSLEKSEPGISENIFYNLIILRLLRIHFFEVLEGDVYRNCGQTMDRRIVIYYNSPTLYSGELKIEYFQNWLWAAG